MLHDRLTTPKGKALVRIIQASLREHRVTIRAGHRVIAKNVPFASVTSYKVVKPGDWNVSAAGPTDRTSSNITLAAGTIHTIVVLDDPGHLFLDDLVDAAGSKVAPGRRAGDRLRRHRAAAWPLRPAVDRAGRGRDAGRHRRVPARAQACRRPRDEQPRAVCSGVRGEG